MNENLIKNSDISLKNKIINFYKEKKKIYLFNFIFFDYNIYFFWILFKF